MTDEESCIALAGPMAEMSFLLGNTGLKVGASLCWFTCESEWDVILQEIVTLPTPSPDVIAHGGGGVGLPLCLISCIYTNLNESTCDPLTPPLPSYAWNLVFIVI